MSDDETYTELAIAAAKAAALLTAFRDVQLVTGVCSCQPGCKNARAVIWHVPIKGVSEFEAYPLSYGVGPEVWTAIVSAHVQFEKVISDQEARADEVAYLEELFEQS